MMLVGRFERDELSDSYVMRGIMYNIADTLSFEFRKNIQFEDVVKKDTVSQGDFCLIYLVQSIA